LFYCLGWLLRQKVEYCLAMLNLPFIDDPIQALQIVAP
jgi:hypothetical protein